MLDINKLQNAKSLGDVTPKGHKIRSLEEIAMNVVKGDGGVRHEIRVPAPDKEFCKAQGARWDSEKMCWYFKCPKDTESHPLNDYRVDSGKWIKLNVDLPFEYRNDFKQHGVVTTQYNGEWGNYVLAVEKYEKLLGVLINMQVIDIDKLGGDESDSQ